MLPILGATEILDDGGVLISSIANGGFEGTQKATEFLGLRRVMER